MGPYCNYCGRRCFLLRVLKDGRTMLLATCDKGMEHDRRVGGETHEDALNPATQPEEVAALVRTLQAQLEVPMPEAAAEGWPIRCEGREAGGRAIGLSVCLWKVDHPAHNVTQVSGG